MKKGSKLKKISLFIVLMFSFLVIFLIISYLINPVAKFNKIFFKTIPYPIASIDETTLLTTRDLLSDIESLERFYTSQDFSEIGMRIDFDTEEGTKRLKIKEKQVFNKLIEDSIIKIIAKSKNIVISKKEAEEELISKSKKAGSTEDLALNLRKLYNWSLSDFRDKVVLPRLYLAALIDYYEEESIELNLPRTEIEKAYQELKAGVNFDEVAIKYSQGDTSENGGSLGWFREEYLSEAIAKKAYSMQPGEFSEIIKSSLGSHLIYLEEIQEKNGIKEVKLKQIFTREGSFLDWLNDKKRNFSIKIFLKDYTWDKKDAKIKFSDQLLEEEEVLLQNKSKGDPSIY